MSSSRFRPPPPKQTADGWDDDIVSADMTLKLSDLLPPSETSLPWIGDVDLACELLNGDSLTAQGELEGNFFNEPVLNPTKHIRVATSSSSKRPSARSEGRDGSREGKRSRTSTSQHHQSTTPADQLPTPSPEPASTHLHPQLTSHRSHRSMEPSSSSAALDGAAPSSGRTHNNTTSASTRPTTVTCSESASVVVPPVDEPSSSTLSVLSWREQTHEGAGLDESHGGGGGGRELDLAASSTSDPSPPEQPSSATQYRLSTRPHTSHRSRSPANSAVVRCHEPAASSSSRPAPSLHRRPSSVHSTTSVTLNSFKTSSIIHPQPRPLNALNWSTSSSSSAAGPSRSYIADEPAKDDFYERKKRDSYIGQHSVLLPEEEETSPASSPRARRPRVGGAKDKRRVGPTIVGGKRIEKPAHRRHKSPPWASKELPIHALECLIPADSARSVPATSGGVKAMDFFRSFLQTINPKTTLTPAVPANGTVSAVEKTGEAETGDVLGSSPVPPAPASEADTNATCPPRPTLRPPTPPRPRPAQPHSKPSAVPSTSRPATTYTVPRSTLATSATSSSSFRRPLQQTLQRSSNLPPRSLPLGPPLTKPTRRIVSSISLHTTSTSSARPTAPKPFNLLTTSLSHSSTSRPPSSLSHTSTSHPTHTPLNPSAGLIPDFSSSHSQLAALERARLARKEALRAKQEEERGKAKEACEAGAVRRREREIYEAERRKEREEGERRRVVEDRLREMKEREQVRAERAATIVKARPVPEMYKSVSRRA